LFNAQGIVSERLAFVPRRGMREYLELHNQIDICLDTFPYAGGTTTNHALWMGVPTLTLVGQTPPSRIGAVSLMPLALEDFIATNPDDFVSKGLQWSHDLSKLADVRSGLRERCSGIPQRRPDVIAHSLEAALRHMWRRWCATLPAESFHSTAACPEF